MQSLFDNDGLALHTDLYQINMVETYWRDGIHNRKAVFELYFRKPPFGNGYAIFAGLEKMLSYLTEFHFAEKDLVYLKEELGFKEDFLAFLRSLRFTGTVKPKGDPAFLNDYDLQSLVFRFSQPTWRNVLFSSCACS